MYSEVAINGRVVIKSQRAVEAADASENGDGRNRDLTNRGGKGGPTVTKIHP